MNDYKTLIGKELETDCGKVTAVALLWNNCDKTCLLQAQTAEGETENFAFSPENNIWKKQQGGGVPLVLFQEVFDTNGKRLGRLENVFFAKNGTLRSLVVNGISFPKGKISCVGDVILLKEKSPYKTAKRKTQSATTAPPKTSSAIATPAQIIEHNGMRRRYGDFGFLVGRRVDKTIVNFQGEVMIKTAEIVTAEILRQAKISGKLLELYLHTE